MITIKTLKLHKEPKTKHHKSGPCDYIYGTIFQILLCACKFKLIESLLIENIDIHPNFHSLELMREDANDSFANWHDQVFSFVQLFVCSLWQLTGWEVYQWIRDYMLICSWHQKTWNILLYGPLYDPFMVLLHLFVVIVVITHCNLGYCRFGSCKRWSITH